MYKNVVILNIFDMTNFLFIKINTQNEITSIITPVFERLKKVALITIVSNSILFKNFLIICNLDKIIITGYPDTEPYIVKEPNIEGYLIMLALPTY